MGKCGCGDNCTCRVVEGIGTDVPGTGNSDNPYVINVDGSEISGPGIGWQSSQFVVRIAPGGNLEFDASGALRATGGGGGGGGYPATVAALEAKATEIIGGTYGAGFYAKPPGLRSSFEHGASAGLDCMTIPVRFLRDGTPVVHPYETMEISTSLGGDHVQNQELNRWESTIHSRPGWKVFHDQELYGAPPSNGSTLGWYGYYEQGQYGLTTLDQVLRAHGGKTVLLINLTFPALNAQGEFITATPSWRTDIFIMRVREMIQAYGLQNSVIVVAYAVSIPSTMNPPRINVLDYFAGAGIRVALQLDTVGDTQTFPAATLPANWTWLLMSSSLSNAVIQPYVDKPKFVLLYGVSRRYLRTDKVLAPTGVGAKGVLSADPEYYGERFGNRHRQTRPDLFHQTLLNGYIPQGGDNIALMHSTRRGSFRLRNTGVGYNRLYLDREMAEPSNSQHITKWVTFGSWNSNPAPASYYMDFGVGFDWDTGAGLSYRWVALAFGIPTDHSFRDRWEPAGQSQFPPDPVNWPLDSGYAFVYDTNGYMFIEAWQQGSRTQIYPAGADVPVNRPVVQNTAKYFRIGVNPNGIRLSDATFAPAVGSDQTTGTYTQGALIADIKTDLSKAYRGAYFFAGRHRANAAFDNGSGNWWGFIEQPQLGLNGAAPAGPTA